jgi:riboflavin kinase/FMN adenylyltransferase
MPAVFLNRTDERPDGFAGCAATIGNFDGVHRGHRSLIDATVRRARELGGPAVAVSFDPPPYQVLFPDTSVRPPLTDLAERTRLLHDAGIDRVAVLRTSTDLLALTPEQFFREVLLRQLGARAVIEGFNFRFGINRTGSTNTLRSLCSAAEIRFEEVPPFELDGEPVSSSRVRAALMTGDVAFAARLLGRRYSIAGTVVKGAERGRTLGFPTANLADVATVLPGNGVYAVQATVSGTAWPAALNIGPNPTFGEDARKIEVHLIGFTGDLYGRKLQVEFATKLRDTRPFAGIAELTEQLKHDIAAARGAVS